MGSGKSTIGSRLAAALDRPFVDNDSRLEQRTGSNAAQLAARDGVGALHREEAEALLDALEHGDGAVIAAAASTIADERVRHALANRAFVVWLRASPATLAARLPQSPTRPFAGEDPARLVAEQSQTRDPLFAQAADLTVDSGAISAGRAVAAIMAALRVR